MKPSKRLSRRERRRLKKELRQSLASATASVDLVATNTAKTVPLDPTTPENIEHWLKYSYGSWKRGDR